MLTGKEFAEQMIPIMRKIKELSDELEPQSKAPLSITISPCYWGVTQLMDGAEPGDENFYRISFWFRPSTGERFWHDGTDF